MINTVARGILTEVGFPLTVWNLKMNHLKKVKPPGEIVKTGSSENHAIVSGEGPLTVILEAGFYSTALDWFYVQPEIAKHTKTKIKDD